MEFFCNLLVYHVSGSGNPVFSLEPGSNLILNESRTLLRSVYSQFIFGIMKKIFNVHVCTGVSFNWF